MIDFITDRMSHSEPDILYSVRYERLLIISLEGQLLGSYQPPVDGWTHSSLVELLKCFPEEWDICGADAVVGEQWVGSTEI